MANDIKESTKKKTEVKTPRATKSKETKTEPAIDNTVIEMLMKQVAELQAQLNHKEEVVVEKAIPTPNKRTVLGDLKDVEVEVKRVIGGTGMVKHIDKKTGDEYTWLEKDSIEYMSVETLRRMKSNQPLFLIAPWIRVVDNENVVEALGLKEIYRNIDLVEDVDKLVKMTEVELIKLTESLSDEYKNVLSTNICQNIVSSDFSHSTIKKFERVLKKDFTSMIE